MARIKKIVGGQDQDLIGGNFTNTASKTIFSLGDFAVESNFTGRKSRDYSNELSSFVTPITLESLNLTSVESEKIFQFTSNVLLNFDKSDLKSFVRFGSGLELFRVAITNIISKYPASLYISSQVVVGGNITVNNYSFDETRDISIFEVPSPYIINSYGIVFDNGNTSKPNDNELRNLNLTYDRFIIWRKDDSTNNSHTVLGYTGDTSTSAWITLQVKGNPFPEITAGTTTDVNYHIKPQILDYNKFVSNLNQIEKYFIGNRLSNNSSFSIKLKEPTLLETGGVIYSDKRLIWNTTDGYNPDQTGVLFETFLESILLIGDNYDKSKTDLIARMLTPSSLKVYDLTDEGKMTKLLRIYGREFDELKTFIDSLVYINKVTYDKKNNISDTLVKNLAKTFGWDVFNLVKEEDITEAFFSTDLEKNNDDSLLPAEIDIELWRRILINTNYYWKSKGTRHAIKSMFMLIGIPEPFIDITEYIYTVDSKINPNQVELSLEDLPSASLPYNAEGYPISPVETKEFYFQISGNTDGGQAYINNFRNVGFNLNRTVDNKKSWVSSGFTERIHYVTPNYFQQDSKLIINTKEIDVTLDLARGIEYDVYCYNKLIDGPITSTGVTRPYLYINIDLAYTGNSLTFQLPEQPLSGSNVQMNFNGITLTPTGSSTGDTGGDYTYDSGTNMVTLISESAVTHSNGKKDIITITYLYDRLGSTGYTQVQYLVQAPTVSVDGAILQLPQEPKGDVQLVVNGVSLTKGTSLFTGDFIIDPNDRTRIIIQNNDLKTYLLTNPIVRVWYIFDNNTSNAEKRSEAHRVDSFTSNKLFYNAGINKYVYVLDYTAFDIDSVKITINGITIQNNLDFTLNPINKKQIYLPANSINFGYVIGAYYIIDDGTITPPLLPADPTFPDISDMSFLEYLELITRRLINVSTRKTITDNNGGYYPTVQNIYEEYLKRSYLSINDPLYSNGYTFKNLYPFINKYNAFFSKFVTELLPATIILRKGDILIRNTAFNRQKFKYRRGVNFDETLQWLGDDGSEFIKTIPRFTYTWLDNYVCVEVVDLCESIFLTNVISNEDGIPIIPIIPPETTEPETTSPETTSPPTTLFVPKLIAVGGYPESQIWKSIDAGDTWNKITTVGGLALETVTFLDSDFGLAGGLAGTVWRTVDGGDNWALIGDPAGTKVTPTATSTFRGSYAPSSSVIYMGASGMFKSLDAGQTWARTPVAGGTTISAKSVYSFNDLTTVVASQIGNRITRTTDGGATWSVIQNSGVLNASYYSVHFNGLNGFAVGSVGIIQKSTDGGVTWVDKTGTLPAPGGNVADNFDVKWTSPTFAYVLGTRFEGPNVKVTLFGTSNGGSSWFDLTEFTPPFLSTPWQMVWYNTSIGWIVTEDGIVLKTENGGVSYTTATLPLASNAYAITLIQ